MQLAPSHDAPEKPSASVALARQEVKGEAIKFAKWLGLFLLVFLLLRGLVIEWVPVNGPSMLPNLNDGDRILVFKLPQTLRGLPFLDGASQYDTGDIVVFDSAADRRRYVKRVIAAGPNLPPPHVANAMASEADATLVRFLGGAVYINNRRLDEPWLSGDALGAKGENQVALKPGQYYVLGDNRPVSKDSRRLGPIEQESIAGRAILRFWPLSRFSLL